MKLYKYRSTSNEAILKRDLETILNNTFYAAGLNEMNDKFEGTFEDTIESSLTFLEKIFNFDSTQIKKQLKNLLQDKDKIGFYCLTKSFTNEALWAHYADNNKGYCIEYDLEKLIDRSNKNDFAFEIEVSYVDKKPILTFDDIRSKKIIKKICGSKKKEFWQHEDEIRLVYDTIGLKNHHEFAITGIYFGCDASEKFISSTIEKFKNRNLSFYKMNINTSSYNMEPILICTNKKNLKYNLKKFSYKLLKEINNPMVTNYYIYIADSLSEDELMELTFAFREKYSYKPNNIYYINSLDVENLIDIYPKTETENSIDTIP